MTRVLIDGQPVRPGGHVPHAATGPHLPDPDAERPHGHGVEPNAGGTFSTGAALPALTRTADDPPDPYGPQGEEVGDDVYAGAAEILRQCYQTLPDGQPSGRIIYED